MTKFSVAISGGGIAGLCLAAELVKCNNIRVDVYEASSKIDDIGAGVTLWGRVCEALQLMDLANDCNRASMDAASKSGCPATSATQFKLRGFRQPDEDFGILPFKDARSLPRGDLIRILLRRVPTRNIHLGKQLRKYGRGDTTSSLRLEFFDGTHAACDVLIGCDGIRSATRAQMMSHEAERTRRKDYLRYIEPRWSGTITYRSLIPSARLAAKNPNHRLLTGGQIYLGKNQHIIGFPVSKTTLNIAVSITDHSKENTRWPLPAWSRSIDKDACKTKIHHRFSDWDTEAVQVIKTIDSSIELAIMNIEPLPFYVRGRVALIGDAAHAAVPYIGVSAAFAIEDAFVLARILSADITTRASLPLALEAYEAIRRPYGNKLITDARLALREFQHNTIHGGDMMRIKESIQHIFDESAGMGGRGQTGPKDDANRGIFWMEVQQRASRLP